MGKAMKAKKIARGRLAKVHVLKGKNEKAAGGLTAKDLTKNKHGRVVSKKRSARGKQNAWTKACMEARKALGVKGFCAVGGKSAQGKAVYTKAKAIMGKKK